MHTNCWKYFFYKPQMEIADLELGSVGKSKEIYKNV
jgi:hypothetical protein